jgi:hypothetical protein
MKRLIVVFTIILLASCAQKPAHEQELTDALATAMINGKISSEKVSVVLEDYAKLNPEDGRRYAYLISAAVSLGADSTKIDAARTKFFAGL